MGAFIPALAPAIIDSDWGFCYSAFGNYYLIFWKGNSVGRLLLLNNPFSKVLPHFSVLKWSPVLESKRAIGFFLFKCYKIRNFAEEPSRSPYCSVIRKPIGNYVRFLMNCNQANQWRFPLWNTGFHINGIMVSWGGSSAIIRFRMKPGLEPKKAIGFFFLIIIKYGTLRKNSWGKNIQLFDFLKMK